MFENIDYVDIFTKKSYFIDNEYIGEISFFQPDTSIPFDDLIDLSSCSDEMYHTIRAFKRNMSPKDLYIDWLCSEKKGYGSIILNKLIEEINPKRIFFIVPDTNLSVKEFYVKTLKDYSKIEDVKQFVLFKKNK